MDYYVILQIPSLRKQLGQAARDSYRKSPFEAKAVASFFTSVYNEVLGERSSSS